MKVLMISLLRIGDLIEHLRILREFEKNHPEAEVTILANDLCLNFLKQHQGPLRYRVFNRSELQAFLVDKHRNPNRALQKFHQWLALIKSENFNYVIDLTHTILSSRLTRALALKPWPYALRWENYLNYLYQAQSEPYFSLSHSLAAKYRVLAQGYKKAASPGPAPRRIGLQVLTSDAKKNWPLVQWKKLAEYMEDAWGSEIILICAPQELNFLQTEFAETGVSVQALTWQALSPFLRTLDLLVTGDTGVMHLAAEARVKIAALYFGSANPFKSYPWLAGSQLLAPKTQCFPCPHGDSCHQPSHLCAEDITPEHAFRFVKSVVAENLEEEIDPSFKTYKVQVAGDGLWLNKIGKGVSMENLARSFEVSVWQIFLDSKSETEARPFGSAAQILLHDHISDLDSRAGANWISQRSDLSSADIGFVKNRLESYHSEDSSKMQEKILLHVRETASGNASNFRQQGDYFFQIQRILSAPSEGFSQLNRIRLGLSELLELLEIEAKLLRNINNEMKERGFAYVAGSRKSSENSFATP
jgi:ADP-heptose:LPS heptosyltransferase